MFNLETNFVFCCDNFVTVGVQKYKNRVVFLPGFLFGVISLKKIIG